ncbi:MAG: hypothetical protein O9270_11590 [Aquidulcibacter sp.]|jgi:hypothetical protein|uniref:hypothetical protein n=1 Tax=Aquidulcibacter sp. TaxID=2052990 RepID=UPI0022BD158D|nr:hypothetical protein [Aquidulcibacter sp.]MCZ8208819.1 hypothetical protein [Aquidulcibacter sp.]
MSTCPWEKIDDFQALSEFNRFASWMNEQVAAGEAGEILVTAPYLDATTFEEKWFRHNDSGQTWRLVLPDFPFTGLFERVEK